MTAVPDWLIALLAVLAFYALCEHWPGPEASPAVVLRCAGA